jgi:macrolide transport system ATP-binding/permease protein
VTAPLRRDQLAAARIEGRLGAAATAEPLIALRGITKTYHRGALAVEVLHGLDIDIHPGEFVAIMGASGSGKSTLMNILGLLDRPTGGSYRFAGREVSSLDSDERALLRQGSFGFIFQQYNLLASATALENVELPAVYAGSSRRERLTRAAELLTSLGLGDRMDHRPNQLSGGQQQRVSIARALMNGGAVILADEPTGALDSKSGAEVMQRLRDLNEQGHTVLLITHDPAVAAQAQRVIELKDGNIVADRQVREAGTVVAAPAGNGRGSHIFRDLAEASRMAIRSLRVNLMRTMLTLLGIIIGVGSVVAMLAIGDGARQAVLDRITAMGTNLLTIRPGAPNFRPQGGVVATLTVDDAKALGELPHVKAAVPEYVGNVTVRYRGNDYATYGDATTEQFPEVRDWPIENGAFFGADDVADFTPVVVLGRTVAKALFDANVDPVGEYVLLGNIPSRVIGVMSGKGAGNFGNDQDDIVFLPITTGMLRLFGQRYVRSILVKVDEASKMNETQEAARQLLIGRHKAEDFQIRNMESLIQTAEETQGTLTLLLGSIAAISLLVGGIGVMNIMLVSVTERTREIGVRMATGARRRNIMLQFNGEALAVCTLGGLIGVAGGLGTVWLFQHFGRPVVFSAGPVLLAFFCAFATGLLFGYLPARKAANLDPVVALGAE